MQNISLGPLSNHKIRWMQLLRLFSGTSFMIEKTLVHVLFGLLCMIWPFMYDLVVYVSFGRLCMIRPFMYYSAVYVLFGCLCMIRPVMYDSAIYV